MSKQFWFGVLVGGVAAAAVVMIFFPFVFHLLKPWNWFDLGVLIMGLLLSAGVTVWAFKHEWVNEKYCIALLAFVGFVMYGIVNYDAKKGTCPPPPQLYGPCSSDQRNADEQHQIQEPNSATP